MASQLLAAVLLFGSSPSLTVALPLPPPAQAAQGRAAESHVHGPGCAHQRGVIVYPDDLYGEGMVEQWAVWMQTADLNYIGLHGPTPQASPQGVGVLSFLGTATQQEFARAMANLSVSVEYEMHSFGYLLPRELFSAHPEFFRQDDTGKRNADKNFCTGNAAGLKLAVISPQFLAFPMQ